MVVSSSLQAHTEKKNSVAPFDSLMAGVSSSNSAMQKNEIYRMQTNQAIAWHSCTNRIIHTVNVPDHPMQFLGTSHTSSTDSLEVVCIETGKWP